MYKSLAILTMPSFLPELYTLAIYLQILYRNFRKEIPDEVPHHRLLSTQSWVVRATLPAMIGQPASKKGVSLDIICNYVCCGYSWTNLVVVMALVDELVVELDGRLCCYM